MALTYYWLDDAWEPQPVKNVIAWAMKFEVGSKVLKHTQIGRGRVSTIFLGLDLGFSMGKAAPVIWESMVFDIPNMDGERERYATKAEAVAGHDALVALALVEWKKRYKREPKIKVENMITIENPYSLAERRAFQSGKHPGAKE